MDFYQLGYPLQKIRKKRNTMATASDTDIKELKELILKLDEKIDDVKITQAREANGKKLKVKAQSREELEVALKAAQDFVAASA